MFRLISKLALVSFFFKSWFFIKKLLIPIILFFFVELIYAKWVFLIDKFNFPLSISIVSIYTFVQLILVLWVIINLFDWQINKKIPQKEILRFKSQNNFEKELIDIEKYPSLKKS